MDSLMLSVHELMAAAAEPLTGSSGAATEHAEEPQLAELVNQEAGLRDEAGACSATEHVARRNEERWRKLRKVAEAIRLNGGILGRRMKYADTESCGGLDPPQNTSLANGRARAMQCIA